MGKKESLSSSRKFVESSEIKSKGEPTQDRRNLLADNRDVIEGDRDGVFKSLISSVEKGWVELDEAQRKNLLDHLRQLLNALRNYHNSYTTLKGISRAREDIPFEDIKKYQKVVQEADQRERALHNAFLDSLNILSRMMKSLGLDNGWRGTEIIYDPDYRTMREKVKRWMFKIFGEEQARDSGV